MILKTSQCNNLGEKPKLRVHPKQNTFKYEKKKKKKNSINIRIFLIRKPKVVNL